MTFLTFIKKITHPVRSEDYSISEYIVMPPRRIIGFVVIFLFSLFFRTAFADDAYSLRMQFLPVDDIMLERMVGDNPLLPKNESVLVFGRIDHEGFYIENFNNIAVETPEGEFLPVIIDASSVLREFDEIISLIVAFEVTENDAEKTGEGFRVVWGESVQIENDVVDQIQIAADKLSLYRQFRWQERFGSDAEGESPFSTITVIADSTAEYHFLWYLLPMGLVFILLTIRKIRAGD